MMMKGKMKPKLGPVKAEKKPYLWKELFEHKVLQGFEGQKPSQGVLKSPAGQKVIAEAKAATTAALGYSLEEAVKADEIKELARELRWNMERSGREEMSAETEPEELM